MHRRLKILQKNIIAYKRRCTFLTKHMHAGGAHSISGQTPLALPSYHLPRIVQYLFYVSQKRHNWGLNRQFSYKQREGMHHLNFARTFRLRRVACSEGNHSGKVRLPAANALTLRVTSVARSEMPSRCHRTAESPLQCWICSAVGVTGSIIACMPAIKQSALPLQ